MHRCSSAHGNLVGSCSCGYYHHHNHQTSSFSMLFSMPTPNHDAPFDQPDFYPSSSAVDCTLSLGTPSTRLSNDVVSAKSHERRSSNSYMPNFCWDILQPKHSPSSPAAYKASRGGGGGGGNGGDPLVARRCANCDTTSTPLWRNGPRGPKSLCNACGIRFKKEERRATAAASTSAGAGQAGIMESQWGHHGQAAQKMQCLTPPFGNEFRFMEDDHDREHDNSIPFLSWRLNVTDRPSLVHDFTR